MGTWTVPIIAINRCISLRFLLFCSSRPAQKKSKSVRHMSFHVEFLLNNIINGNYISMNKRRKIRKQATGRRQQQIMLKESRLILLIKQDRKGNVCACELPSVLILLVTLKCITPYQYPCVCFVGCACMQPLWKMTHANLLFSTYLLEFNHRNKGSKWKEKKWKPFRNKSNG